MKITLRKQQINKISDLALNLGQLFFASTVIPYLVPALDKPPFGVLILGIILALSLWIYAIWIVKA